jgi:CheY-like chemotaxis protein
MPRLLWTDDDGPDRFLREAYDLHRAGWTVRWASSLSEAVDVLSDEPLDAVLVDQMLPWQGGLTGGAVGGPPSRPLVWSGCALLWWLRGLGPPPGPPPATAVALAGLWTRPPPLRGAHLPAAVVSAFDDPDLRAALDELRGVPVWTKPVDRPLLMGFLGSVAAAAPAGGAGPSAEGA